jgi:hypothetical protein
MGYECKCKICKSEIAEDLEFCRFYLKWDYSTIIDVYGEYIDNLNEYNLSNHFNNHADRETTRFWRNLRETVGIYEPSAEESKRIFERVKHSLGISNQRFVAFPR